MSREEKRIIHNPKIKITMEPDKSDCLAETGAKASLVKKDHHDGLNGTMSFMGEGVPGTLDELLEESCKGSFNILRGLG